MREENEYSGWGSLEMKSNNVVERWQCLSVKKGKIVTSFDNRATGAIQCGTCYHYESYYDIHGRKTYLLTTLVPMQETCQLCGAWLYWRKIKKSIPGRRVERKIVLDNEE